MHAARLTRLLLCLTLAGLIGASAAAAQGGLGDPFFPRSGNPGYDVSHYDARLFYRPGSGELGATATIDATASQRLRRLSLDLEGLRVTAVTVDGADAGFARGDGKLTVTPAAALPSGAPFTVAVDYEGRPHHIVDADGTAEGWERTGDGAAALGEPLGTATWLPCNNTLTDKASFDFHITVPEQLKGVGNGRLLSIARAGSTKTFEWRESQPMAPYLATIDIGRGSLVRSEIAGVPAWTMLDPRVEKRSRRVLAALPEIIRFESSVFGPYPFDAAGAIVDVTPRTYALEAQTRPIFSQPPDLTTLVHEMAHQWFGDSVGLERWPDIWLNEGFATWAQWYYAERHGGPSARQTFRSFYRFPASKQRLWDPPPGHPGNAANLFAGSVYLRGAMALEALRLKVGTKPMLRTLRRWTSEHRYGNADIGQFIALAEQVSGRQLEPLFDRWLYRPGKPPGSTARPFETRSRASQLTRLRSASPVAAT